MGLTIMGKDKVRYVVICMGYRPKLCEHDMGNFHDTELAGVLSTNA